MRTMVKFGGLLAALTGVALAGALAKDGDIQGAIRELNRALAIDPTSSAARTYLEVLKGPPQPGPSGP